VALDRKTAQKQERDSQRRGCAGAGAW